MNLKEIEYSPERKVELIATGHFWEYEYFILNLGWHPTAYVKIPESHPFFGKFYDDVDLEVHGRLTYSADHLWISEEVKINGWFLGWDYAHYGDYNGYMELPELKRFYENFSKEMTGRKWKTIEIRRCIKFACEQLKEIKEEYEK